ncbi:MAG: class B sortase [Solobacterium sp.]|nr:class B sortase [Solobacterium sp.]
MSEQEKHEFTLDDILASTGTFKKQEVKKEAKEEALEEKTESVVSSSVQPQEVVSEPVEVQENVDEVEKENLFNRDLENTQTIQVQDEVEEVTPPPTPKRTATAKKKKKLSKVGLLVMRGILVLSLGVAAFSGWKLYTGLKAYREGNQTYDNLVEYTQAGDTSGGSVEAAIDFEALKRINPDFVGWLKLDGTIINYPVVQGADNAYYLEHLFNGDVNHMGCIFMHYGNNKDMTDKNTWIFAHHTNNGSMFYTLENYKSQSFYDEHPQFTFETPDALYLIEPVAGTVLSGDEFGIETFMPSENYTYNSQEFMDWVQFFVNQSTFKSNITIQESDQIVTMVTCTDDYHNARYALISRLTKVR